MMDFFLLWIRFNCDPIAFTIPFIDHPIAWYGCIFALSFYLGHKIFIWMYVRQSLPKVAIPEKYKSLKVPGSFILNKRNQKLYTFLLKRTSNKDCLETLKLKLFIEETFPKEVESIQSIGTKFSDSALLYIITATIIGARLGHIFFYEEIGAFIQSPLLIIKTWEGGLASHGGIFAIIVASLLFTKKNKTISFLSFMDLLSIPTMFVCAWIRIGNFINQEILGNVTSLPWAIIFMNPAIKGPLYPRHPIQLYEFFLYMGVFTLLFILWYKNTYRKRRGLFLGLALTVSFSARFFLEFLKEPQSIYDTSDIFQMGQLLSLPMIICGFFLINQSLRLKESLDKKVLED